MYTVTRVIRFCYGHRLMEYAGKCRYFHGHNGKAEIELAGEKLDNCGMLRDFEDIKRTIQVWIDAKLDHAMLLRKDDPLLPALRKNGERLFVMDENPTAEAIARVIFDYAASQRLPVSEVRLWETDLSVAGYRRGRAERAPATEARSRRRSISTAA
jgi:6-pyruvoyltetrahydropterin/6-carboxytetrahydropterin synthase